MNIYIINNSTLKKVKKIPYNATTLARYENEEYTKLYPNYDSDLHTCVVIETLPTYFKLSDDEVVELTNYEKYSNGYLDLADGEYIDFDLEEIVIVEQPNAYYEWDSDNNEWSISDDNKDLFLDDIKTSLASYKYSQQEGLTIETDNLTNISASYNYLLLKDAIETFEEDGTPVRWKNLDGARIDITDNLLLELKSIKTQTRTHYQACFDAQEDIETYINTLTSDELQDVVISELWNEYYQS